MADDELLNVKEVEATSVTLMAAAYYLRGHCDAQNKAFILCKDSHGNDPAKCLAEGKAVTECTHDFFRKMLANCRKEFEAQVACLDSHNVEYQYCRKTQKALDKCALEKLGLEGSGLTLRFNQMP
eukprot:Opistho-1_new@69788